MKTQNIIKKNIEMFEDRFSVMLERAGTENGEKIEYGESSEDWTNQVEDFLTRRTTTLIQSIVEDVEGIKITDSEKMEQFAFMHTKGFNQALSQVQEYLNKVI